MKARTSLFVAVLLLGAASQAVSADSFTLSERSGNKVVCSREEGGTFCDTAPTGGFSVRGSVGWEGVVDISAIDGDTTFNLSLGNLSIAVSLSEDPSYVAGKRSATFAYGHINDHDRFVKDVTVKLRWSEKALTVTVSGKVNFDQASILADNYSGEVGAFTDMVELSLSFAGLNLTVPIDITGKTTHKTVTKGRGEFAEEFEITTVSLKGRPSPR